RRWHAACTPRVECCDRLRREHDVVCDVLAGVESVVDPMARGIAVPGALLAAAIEFFDAFVVHCHEAKEEQALFPLLERRGVPPETLAALQGQHADCQRILALLRGSTTPRHIDVDTVRLFEQYVELERSHLAFESRTFITLAEAVLDAADDAALCAAFDGIE